MGEVEGPILKLTMEKGPLAGQVVEFKPGISVRVGRVVRGNNLTIQDSGISSKHLTIEFNSSDGKWFIRDLGSSNGTFLNDGKLDPSCAACLSDCDVVKIGELTSIKVQIGDAARAPTRSRRNAGRKAAIDTATSDAAAENCELGLVSEDADRASTRPRRNPRRKAATDTTASDDGNAAVKSQGENPRSKAVTDTTTSDDGDAAVKCELGLVGENAKPRRNSRRKAATDTATADDRDPAEKCELGLVDEELGNNNKGKRGRPPRPRTRAKTQAQRDSESVKAELQPEGIELENAGISMTTSSSKAENFDGGASQVETGDNEIVENSSAIETASQYADENASGEAKKGHQKPKTDQFTGRECYHGRRGGSSKKLSISKEHAQCKVEAIRSMEEERQSGRKGNHTVEEQLTFEEEEASHGSPNVSGGNMGKPDVEEVNLEILTLGEWLDYLEIYVPKQIIDVTEEMILEMRKKVEKLQEFMLHQKNAKENTLKVEARELELCTAQGLLCIVAIGILATNRKKNLSNGNTGTNTLRLTKSSSHASLEPISSSTRQHLVNTQHMERMNPDPKVESILPCKLGHILVASNTCCFKCLTGDIFLLPTDQMHTEGKFIHALFLHPHIIDPDLWIWHTTAVP
nr:FHA domain-containing protein At4g14490-like [Ipomoea batatas]